MTNPLLDVSEVLEDPMFLQNLTILRRAVVIGSNGREVVTQTTLTPFGVVTSGSSLDLIRTDTYEAATNSITVHVKGFRLIDPQNSKRPDTVLWQEDEYVVKKSSNYSQYGAGFTMAECQLAAPVTSS
jgi:galactose-6-phosphate isomerase